MYPSMPLPSTTSGIHLAYSRNPDQTISPTGSGALYRIAAVGAALLLVITAF